MRISTIAAACAAGAMTFNVFAAAAADDLADSAIGVWLRPSKGWHVEFALCGDKLCGEVISGEGKDKKTGESVVGVKMLYDLEKASEDTWEGKMYNPGDGHEYLGKVRVLSEDEIKMSGCMLGGLICRSEKWQRVEDMPMADDSMEEDAEEMMEDAAEAMDDAADAMDDAMDAAEDAMEEATDDN